MPASTYPSAGPGGQSCSLCGYFQQNQVNTTNGICRRLPPPNAVAPGAAAHQDAWPSTFRHDWCGEFSIGGLSVSAGTLVVPTPAPDGIITAFTGGGLSSVSLVFVNGDLAAVANYTVVGNVVTFGAGSIPQPGDEIQFFGKA